MHDFDNEIKNFKNNKSQLNNNQYAMRLSTDNYMMQLVLFGKNGNKPTKEEVMKFLYNYSKPKRKWFKWLK